MTKPLQPIKPGRLMSLDVFRGLTIAAMLLVNNAGDWSHVWGPLEHAEWHGCTSTDLIFPFFLFIMGVAMQFSFAGRLEKPGGKIDLIGQICRRTIIIFLLGIILAMFIWPSYLGHFRMYGVLERIAICYFFASFIMLYTGVRGQVFFFLLLMAIYYIILKFIPMPGQMAGGLERYKNIVDYTDTGIFGNLNYEWDAGLKMGHDPEGLLSTIPSICTTLAGGLCGFWLRRKEKGDFEKVAGMSAIGVLLIIAGKLLKHDIPMNKNLWTPSYVIYTAGAALLCLSVCYWLIDIKGWRMWAKPFLYYGTNAIAAYFGASMMGLIIVMVRVTGDGGKVMRLKTYLFTHYYKSWMPGIFGVYATSAAWGASFVILWCIITWILYRKKIFIKV
jgi:predicted acyltransferase